VIGNYRVGVRSHNMLRASPQMTIRYGQPVIADFGVLRGGDSNGDSNGDSKGDNAVTLVDFSILRSNFGISGDLLPPVQHCRQEIASTSQSGSMAPAQSTVRRRI
jgi:hypothetical protein